MSMQAIADAIGAGSIGILIILLGMIKIPQMEFNFWGWLGRMIGKAINGEVLEKVGELTEDLDSFKKEAELERVRQARQRILRFNDEILFHQKHSKEHFDEILEDINLYEKYCKAHEDYENNRAELAIENIKDVYQKCMDKHDFLSPTKEAV